MGQIVLSLVDDDFTGRQMKLYSELYCIVFYSMVLY